jgi:hypothetical protein
MIGQTPLGARPLGASRSAITPSAVLVFIAIPAPHPHLPADHHDPVAYGVELSLAAAVLFVGWKLVAGRVFRPARDEEEETT